MMTIGRFLRAYPALRSLALAGVMILLSHLAAAACPNCGLDALAQQKGGQGVVDGFTYSIVGMAGMPFLVLAAVAGYIVRGYRARREEGDAGDR